VARVTHEHRHEALGGGAVRGVQTPQDHERDVDVAELGDSLATLRLCDASALATMRRSLERHGQLSALSLFCGGGHLEIIDGFKRVRAARALGLRTLRAHVADVDLAEAKVQLAALHDRRGLTELEEGWLIRSLYRDHHLSQPSIAARLGRHKSWVFRRLMLVESLDPAVQADVRLGLLAPRAAVAVSQLPRGNQHDLAGLVVRRGLTVRQTEMVVAELLDLDDDATRAQHIARRMEGPAPSTKPGVRATRLARSETDWMAGDIRTVRLVAARLEARLSGGTLAAIGVDAAVLAGESLLALVPVLVALQHTITRVCDAKLSLPEKDAA
jgi:ParB family transcriptional regulator, chromosome partitioning protein